MRSIRVFAAAFVLSLSLPITAEAQTSRTQAEPLRGFDGYVAQAVREWKVPGLAIAVVKDDSVVFARGYGVRALGDTGQVTVHTLFANASTTKAFTSLAVALMVDSGRMQWDDPASRWLPEAQMREPYVNQQLTVRDLLSHRVGFADPEYLWYGSSLSLTEVSRRLRYVPPQTSFRSAFAYNNVTYALAGTAAGRAAGMPWDSLILTRILLPLGMSETRTGDSGLVGGLNVAQPHQLVHDTLRNIGPGPIGLADAIPAAGAMFSNALDMTRWIRFLLDSGRVGGKRLLSDSAYRELFRPQAVVTPGEFYPTVRLTEPHFTAYGLGWFLEDYRGEFVAFHTGSINGYSAIVGLMPSHRIGVVIFANLDHAELRHALMYRVFDSWLPPPQRDWSTDMRALYDSLRQASRDSTRAREGRRIVGTHPSLPLEQYAGTYSDSLYGTMTVALQRDTLMANRGVLLDGTLEHWNYDVFRLRYFREWIAPDYVTFRLDQYGEVQSLEVGEAVFRRVKTPSSR